MKIISIQTGDMQIAVDAIFQTGPVGSGIITCLYDSHRNKGAISYSLFISPRKETQHLGLYLEKALPTLTKKLIAEGSDIAHISAKICGGATILQPPPLLNWVEPFTEQINEQLQKNSLLPAGYDLGGLTARVVEFNCHTGKVLIKSGSTEMTL